MVYKYKAKKRSYAKRRGYKKTYTRSNAVKPRTRVYMVGKSKTELKKFDFHHIGPTVGDNTGADIVAAGPLTVATSSQVTGGASSTAKVFAIYRPTQGTGNNQRVGNDTCVKSWHIKGHIDVNATMPDPGEARILLVLDKAPNAAIAATWGMIMNTPTAQTNTINSFQLVDQMERFKVLYDQKFTFPGDDSNVRQNIPIDHRLDFGKGINVKQTGSSSDVASLVNNSFLLLLVGSEPTAAGVNDGTGVGSMFEVSNRFRFTDE